LRLPDDVLDGIVGWQKDLALPGRVVPRENLHVTLAFLGSTPAAAVPAIAAALRDAAAAAAPISFEVSGYREGRSVGMLVLDDAAGQAASLAHDLHDRLRRLGVYEPEKRPWLPHCSVVRFRARPRLHPERPALGRFMPSDAALYNSLLRSTGAQYVVTETTALGGS
jgi:2'-5' RNA ligase